MLNICIIKQWKVLSVSLSETHVCCVFCLQVFSQLQSVLGVASVSLHLVEVSPVLSRLQAQNLTGTRSQEAASEDEPVYRRGETSTGLPVSWYRRLDDVPAGTVLYFIHIHSWYIFIHTFKLHLYELCYISINLLLMIILLRSHRWLLLVKSAGKSAFCGD